VTKEKPTRDYDSTTENENLRASNEDGGGWIDFSSEEDLPVQETSTMNYTTMKVSSTGKTRSENIGTSANSFRLESTTMRSFENLNTPETEVTRKTQKGNRLPSNFLFKTTNMNLTNQNNRSTDISNILQVLVCIPISPTVNHLAKN